MKQIKISCYWPDDWKSVILSEKEWENLLKGKKLSLEGESYSYEGQNYSAWWEFKGGKDSKVIVTYSAQPEEMEEDEENQDQGFPFSDYSGGVGFEGSLSECTIDEL